ncbi:hypothetical protein BLNAU_16471 [Blattamonas nauphoetae]|uniref:Uncharacterized protein n=1 Tax=Blattamonas nauphoetae TaxID=2049346 RepID=A0ABQ9XBB9_9EUKA|nr:hypothetical protein BLNAU_16471 [Blattamonas nauphoetae]
MPTESVVVILTSSNEALIRETLTLLREMMMKSSGSIWFDFLTTGFFRLLPQSFYEQELHLLLISKLKLMDLVIHFLVRMRPDSSHQLCRNKHISKEFFDQPVLDLIFHPIQPFLEFICKHRRRIEDRFESYFFDQLLSNLLVSSPFFEQMTQFVLSSSVFLAITDSITFFEPDSLTKSFLEMGLDGMKYLQGQCPTVQKRGQQIVTKLCEEGISDEWDQQCHLQSRNLFGDNQNSQCTHHITLLFPALPLPLNKWLAGVCDDHCLLHPDHPALWRCRSIEGAIAETVGNSPSAEFERRTCGLVEGGVDDSGADGKVEAGPVVDHRVNL